jgi:hypothetical protein
MNEMYKNSKKCTSSTSFGFSANNRFLFALDLFAVDCVEKKIVIHTITIIILSLADYW